MLIITKEKKYYWDYKILLRNLIGLAIAIFFISSYLILSTMDFRMLVK